jgi:hypothetical protein
MANPEQRNNQRFMNNVWRRDNDSNFQHFRPDSTAPYTPASLAPAMNHARYYTALFFSSHFVGLPN